MFFPSKRCSRFFPLAVSASLFACVAFTSPGFAQEVTSEAAPESAQDSNPIAQLPDAPEEKVGAEKPATQAPAASAPQTPQDPQAEAQTAVQKETRSRAQVEDVPAMPDASVAPMTSAVNSAPHATGALAPDADWDILDQPRKIEAQSAPSVPQPIKPRAQSPFSSEPLRTIAERHNLALPLPQGRIVVDKSERRLDMYNGNTLLKSYRVALGNRPNGHKVKQGDGRTPEGDFYICTRNAKTSAFHIFLGLSYPALPDAKRAVNSKQITWREYQIIHQRLASRGRPPWETNLGGWVGIHGGTDASFAQKKKRERGSSDWTAGCVALTNREIEEIYAATRLGTPVKVQP